MSEGIDINKKKILHAFFNPNKKVNTKADETNIDK